MNKYHYLLIIFLLLVLAYIPEAQADNTGLLGFFSFIKGLGEDFWVLVTDTTPSLIERFVAWFLKYWVLMQIYSFAAAIEFGWGVASVILEDLAFGSQLNSLVGFLPNDVKATLSAIRIFDAIELIVQAYVTKFVMDLMRG